MARRGRGAEQAGQSSDNRDAGQRERPGGGINTGEHVQEHYSLRPFKVQGLDCPRPKNGRFYNNKEAVILAMELRQKGVFVKHIHDAWKKDDLIPISIRDSCCTATSIPGFHAPIRALMM